MDFYGSLPQGHFVHLTCKSQALRQISSFCHIGHESNSLCLTENDRLWFFWFLT